MDYSRSVGFEGILALAETERSLQDLLATMVGEIPVVGLEIGGAADAIKEELSAFLIRMARGYINGSAVA